MSVRGDYVKSNVLSIFSCSVMIDSMFGLAVMMNVCAPCPCKDAVGIETTLEEIPFHDTFTVEEAKKIIDSDKDVVILDVRRTSEYRAGHIDNSLLIPLHELRDRIHELDKDDYFIVYCKLGVRSEKACRIMAQHGFENTHNMEGGMDVWSLVGYEVIRPQAKQLDLGIEDLIANNHDGFKFDIGFKIPLEEIHANDAVAGSAVFFDLVII
jgi:rhodanese-related sulfurtransferase